MVLSCVLRGIEMFSSPSSVPLSLARFFMSAFRLVAIGDVTTFLVIYI